ncbi:type II toxin-antitoxin system HicB family antitoxin [Labrys portucalensis]|uniref:Type II toxin-antitoxin system HicB family antitoxin n=1 Tax=Labrys neptuniae TaxID=376174 RepID=A0ABV6ZJY1_9HYPH
MNWIYGVAISRDGDDFVVSVRDLPEVVTSGDNEAQALELAADAIGVIVAGRIKDEADLPEPSALQSGEHAVPLAAQLAAKASIYSLWRAAKVSKSELARRLGLNEGEVRRLLNPEHATKLDRIDEAARALGGRIVVGAEPMAA